MQLRLAIIARKTKKRTLRRLASGKRWQREGKSSSKQFTTSPAVRFFFHEYGRRVGMVPRSSLKEGKYSQMVEKRTKTTQQQTKQNQPQPTGRDSTTKYEKLRVATLYGRLPTSPGSLAHNRLSHSSDTVRNLSLKPPNTSENFKRCTSCSQTLAPFSHPSQTNWP